MDEALRRIWQAEAGRKDSPDSVRIDGVLYSLGTGKDTGAWRSDWQDDDSGASYIRFDTRSDLTDPDGRLVKTIELREIGAIPAAFRGALPDNARFLTPDQYREEAEAMERDGGNYRVLLDGTRIWTPAPTREQIEAEYGDYLMSGSADAILDGRAGEGVAKDFREWLERNSRQPEPQPTDHQGEYEVWSPLRYEEEDDPLEWPNDFGLRMTVRAASLEDAFARVRDDIGEGDYISAPGKDYRLSNGALIPEPHEMEAMPSAAPEPQPTAPEAVAHDLKIWREMHTPGATQPEAAIPALPSDVETGMDESDFYEVWHPDRAESEDRPLRWTADYWPDMAVRAASLEHAFSQLREWMAPGDYLAAPGGKDYCLTDDGSLRYESKEPAPIPASEPARKMASAEDLATRWRERVSEQARGVKPPFAVNSQTVESVVAAWRMMYDPPVREETNGREPPAGKAPDRDNGR